MADTGDKVIRVYSDFRGIDLRGEECALNRSPDALNVWRDYKELSGIKTRPALKHICRSGRAVKDMKWHGNRLYYYSSKGAYHYVEFKDDGSLDHVGDDLDPLGEHGLLFSFNGSLYGLGSNGFLRIAGDGENTYFVPTTSVGALPNGAGRKVHQDVNLLTPWRKNTFCGDYYNPKDYPEYDGTYSSELHLDAEEIDEDADVYITIDGVSFKVGDDVPESLREYFTIVEVDYKGGIVSFYSGGSGDIGSGKLPAPQTVGRDNITVKFRKSTGTVNAVGQDDNARKILGCTIVEQFDNRIFVSGNPAYPNLVFHSSLDNPMYFSDLDVYEDGKDDGRIRAMVAGNNALWVFRDTDKGDGVYYHTAAFDNTYGKVYPSAHSSVSLGCVGGAVNFLDDILFFSRNGMESISQNITAEQFATHKSSLVDRLMLANTYYKDMVLAEWEGYLLVFIGNEVYLADSRAILANEGHHEYEWYHWNLGRYNINCAAVKDGKLYIGTDGEVDDELVEGHIYCLDLNGNEDVHDDKNVAIESYWTTPRDKFASSNKQKATNKKGCIVEATGDLTVSSKVDGDDGFDDGEVYTGITDHVVPKIKRKKFKDIQLKFKSNTKFKLESVTLEAFVGSFIKR